MVPPYRQQSLTEPPISISLYGPIDAHDANPAKAPTASISHTVLKTLQELIITGAWDTTDIMDLLCRHGGPCLTHLTIPVAKRNIQRLYTLLLRCPMLRVLTITHDLQDPLAGFLPLDGAGRMNFPGPKHILPALQEVRAPAAFIRKIYPLSSRPGLHTVIVHEPYAIICCNNKKLYGAHDEIIDAVYTKDANSTLRHLDIGIVFTPWENLRELLRTVSAKYTGLVSLTIWLHDIEDTPLMSRGAAANAKDSYMNILSDIYTGKIYMSTTTMRKLKIVQRSSRKLTRDEEKYIISLLNLNGSSLYGLTTFAFGNDNRVVYCTRDSTTHPWRRKDNVCYGGPSLGIVDKFVSRMANGF